MEEVKQYQHSIIKWVYIVTACILVYMFLAEKQYIPGYLLGACTSLLVFNSRVKSAIKFGSGVSRGKSFANYIFRYFTYGVAIFLSFWLEKLEIIPTLIGIFQIYLIILLQAYFSVKNTRNGNDN